MSTKRLALIAVPLAATAIAAGCGGSSSSKSASSPSASSPGALSADATSASTGDIPDNQNFLTYRDRRAGFSISYPEGWAQKPSARGVAFQDKNNLVRISVTAGPPPSVASVKARLAGLTSTQPTLKAAPPQLVTIKGGRAVKVVYTTRSAPNSVTGKRVTLMVDRYELGRSGKVAVIELGTPRGVDNVDAYRMMVASFTWR